MSVSERRIAWDDVELGEIVTLHRGYDLPAALRRDGAVPVVSSSGITGYHDEAKVQPPGVVTGRYGTLGEVFFVQRPFWPLNTTLYVSDFQGNDARFISYFLRCQDLGSRDGAAAVPGINRNVLHRLPAKRPPVPTQRKIAAILSAYDDLIENNHRRIKIFEEMAQRIYREWFVDLRYPGHEDVQLVNSELGSIPEGWSVAPLSELGIVTMGQSPPSSAYNRDGLGLPFHQGVGTYGGHFPVHDVYSTAGARLANDGDILLSVRAPVGRINLADCQMILGRGLCGIGAEVAPREFLLHALKHFFREEDVIGGGTIFKSATQRDVQGLQLVWPGPILAAKFAEIAQPVWGQLRLLTVAGTNLRATRDLLLPQLISGKVDVTDLEIAVTDLAA